MSYGIDEKEEFLLERKLDELVTTPTGKIGKAAPGVTGDFDRRAFQKAKKQKPKVNPNPALAVEPAPVEPSSIGKGIGLPILVPTKPKPKPKPKPIKAKTKVIPLGGKDSKKIAAPVLKKKPYKFTPTLLQPVERPLLKTDKPRYQLPTTLRKQLSTTSRKQLSTVNKLPSQSQLKLPQAQVKIPAQVSQANNRINSIRRSWIKLQEIRRID